MKTIQTSANGYAVVCGEIEDHRNSGRQLPWCAIKSEGLSQWFKTKEEAIKFVRGY